MNFRKLLFLFDDLQPWNQVGGSVFCFVFYGFHVGFMFIKVNISLRITIYIYCQLIRNLKGHTQK